jgi:pantetheine-phosphate adenylyltransferase
VKKAVYPGSFDPITRGHIDIANRALKVFDELTILISQNPEKKTFFTAEERKKLVEEIFSDEPRIMVDIATGLTVDEAEKHGASHIVRGLRALTDFEYEFQMTQTNRQMNKKIDTVFFMTSNQFSYLSSKTVKEISFLNGEIGQFVPENVENALKNKRNL